MEKEGGDGVETLELNILEIIWNSGLVVKLILLILIVASIVSWAIVLIKKKIIRGYNKRNRVFMDVFQRSGDALRQVMVECQKMPFSPFKTMFIEGHKELDKIVQCSQGKDRDALKNHFRSFGLSAVERSLKKGMNDSNVQLDSFLATLASIGSLSPFIGLLGTVWGIIDSFKSLAQGGETLNAVAPGIAEALVATAIGLAVAIPAVWFYNHFNHENEKINTDMESFKEQFLNSVERTLI